MSLHNDIMNLRHGDPMGINAAENLMFKYGFKEARHAAAELALKTDAELERLKTFNAKLLIQDDLTGTLMEVIDRMREHFNEDGTLRGSGQWRCDEIASCFKRAESARKENVARQDTVDAKAEAEAV